MTSIDDGTQVPPVVMQTAVVISLFKFFSGFLPLFDRDRRETGKGERVRGDMQQRSGIEPRPWW